MIITLISDKYYGTIMDRAGLRRMEMARLDLPVHIRICSATDSATMGPDTLL